MILLKSDRCSICKVNRGYRFCLKTGKNICWHDCNELRVDYKCPDACKYSLIKHQNSVSQGLLQYKTNADSQTEFQDLLKKEMDKWIINPQEVFDGKIPIQMIENEQGKKEIETLFNNMNTPNYVPLIHLKERLKLDNLKVKSHIKNYEDFAFEFLNIIIEQDWSRLIDLMYNQEHYKEEKYKLNFIRRISGNKIIKKIKDYDLISSALSEDKNQALVFFEVNGKYDLTLIFRKQRDSWRFTGKIFGKPELYNGENEAIQQVAVLLSKNQLSNVYKLLQKYSSIYVDSADFQYYWGLYYTFAKNPQKAKEFFFNTIEIDPSFYEAKYNYALILHSEKKIEETKQLYEEILQVAPKEIKTMNNLASIHIDEGRYKEAKNLLEKCLKINKNFEIAQKNLDRVNKLIDSVKN